MKRLHQIVSGTGHGPFEKDSGYRWQLDGSNDWWAALEGTQLIVAHRYNQERAATLAAFCKLEFS